MFARLVCTSLRRRGAAVPAMRMSSKPFVPEHDKPHARSIIVETVLDEDDDEEDMEDMVMIGPAGTEWGGPQRGGKYKEPTRFGDWEKKGRCCDF
ncbi:hypothetical protein H310_07118 [Aphanomyces invadans]|uniref:Uncharacterized protein n=1 Tax=Aphanomyces invadans TaxID=157072 RepID=A0A024U2R8_9STRA|nr:hypothetical protein H310_07118 [Aphanomyces invadans]ETW00505.1 hypothetical protein H310_07118 [Aphanomyces invadans]|eukprot:XP_008870640.1 hypothetical protein H310_07118 [Aphanomyces invadans]